jgi:hypothetical protein
MGDKYFCFILKPVNKCTFHRCPDEEEKREAGKARVYAYLRKGTNSVKEVLASSIGQQFS